MSAAALRTVTLEDGKKVTYDSDMPMGALRAVMSAASQSNLDDLVRGMTGIVTEWDFDGDPTTSDGWDGLRRSEFNAVIGAVVGDLGELGNDSAA